MEFVCTGPKTPKTPKICKPTPWEHNPGPLSREDLKGIKGLWAYARTTYNVGLGPWRLASARSLVPKLKYTDFTNRSTYSWRAEAQQYHSYALAQRFLIPLRSSRERGHVFYSQWVGLHILGVLGVFGPAHTNCFFDLGIVKNLWARTHELQFRASCYRKS